MDQAPVEYLGPVWGLAANVKSDRALRAGAKVYICYCNGDAEKPVVIGLSKSGKPIEKYTTYKRLENFRAAWIPESIRDRVGWLYQTKAEAQDSADKLTAIWTGVRYFSRDGKTILQDGISANKALDGTRAG